MELSINIVTFNELATQQKGNEFEHKQRQNI